MVGSRFVASSSGDVSSISVYIYNPSKTVGTIKCAIYSDTNKALIATTEQKTIPIGFDNWQTLNFANKPYLTSGTSYSLVVWFSTSGCYIRYDSGNSRQSWYANQAYGNFPNGPYTSFSNYNQENIVYSIYCTIGASPSASPSAPTTPTPPAGNLVPIPTGWWIDRNGQTLDYSVTYNGMPSIRLDKTTSGNNPGRECNSITVSVHPGDRLVFSCWMKTTASGYGDTNPYAGARIGMDFYDNQRIAALQSPTWPNTDQGVLANYVKWGTNGWVQRTIEITIPTSMPADGYLGHPAGGSYTPTNIILWMQVWSSTYGTTDTGKAWFANPTLYITH